LLGSERRSPVTIHVGTSGWSYSGWRGRFYPPELPSRNWLPYFAQHFTTVEINMTFYRFPQPATLRGWLVKTPPNFKFTLKANRRITHLKKLKDVAHDVRYFYILAANLKDKLGCILFQLPPSLAIDLELLDNFLDTLSSQFQNVIEFRHQSWYTPEVYQRLQLHQVAFCNVSSKKVPPTSLVTARASYFRFHGLTGGYRYSYPEEELRQWAEEIKKVQAEETYVYFNNDYKAFAVYNAQTIKKLITD